MSDESTDKKREDFLDEITRWAKISQSANPMMEIDLKKAADTLRTEAKAPADQIAELEKMVREPEKLMWQLMPPLPDEPLNWTPSEQQVNWFREMISRATDGIKWKVPSTGQVYQIDKVNKTFTLIIDTDNDKERWHERNKMILALLGYTMIDNKSSAKSFTATGEHWILGVFDFSIAEQENPKTPGQNFPPGSRGQDSVATAGKNAAFIRLGHVIGAHLWKAAQQASGPDAFGKGKTNAPWLKIKEKHGSN